jgi:hypothetical protein
MDSSFDALLFTAIREDELNHHRQDALLVREGCLSSTLRASLREKGHASLYSYLKTHRYPLSRYGIHLMKTGDIIQGPYWKDLMSDEEEIYSLG